MRLLGRYPFLTSVAVEPTNDCDMSCPYCHRKQRPINYMPFELYKQVIQQIPHWARVCLSYGGESWLHPDFVTMLYLAHKRGFKKLTVYSNGNWPYYQSSASFVGTLLDVVVGSKPPATIISPDQRVTSTSVPLKVVRNYCPSLFHYIGILWNGDIVPCCHDVAGTRVMGNASTQSLKEVWRSTKYKELRKAGHCEGCEIYQYEGM